MDAFTFQPASGAQGIYTNACLIRAYHESRGDGGKRDEIITTAFSHPADAATPAVAGFKVITLMPGEMGFAEVDALKAAVSERTAGLMLTNPEDTGQYNPNIRAFVDIVHEAGGLCAYDQANGNPLLGIVRAGDTGFDMCQFNLHKTFSAPHGALGLGCAAVGVKEHLERFLPRPIVTYDGERYGLDHEPGEGIEKIRAFIGNVHAVLKAYAWVRSLGAEGLRAVAETAVLNNNYMLHNIRQIEGTTIPWPKNTYPKLEQVRYSWEPLYEETGVASHDVLNRMVDFGVQHYMESHVPMLVPQPFTLEPGESLTIAEMDHVLGALRRIAEEARNTPEHVTAAPHSAAIRPIDGDVPEDPDCWAFTSRAYRRKRGNWANVKRGLGGHGGGGTAEPQPYGPARARPDRQPDRRHGRQRRAQGHGHGGDPERGACARCGAAGGRTRGRGAGRARRRTARTGTPRGSRRDGGGDRARRGPPPDRRGRPGRGGDQRGGHARGGRGDGGRRRPAHRLRRRRRHRARHGGRLGRPGARDRRAGRGQDALGGLRHQPPRRRRPRAQGARPGHRRAAARGDGYRRRGVPRWQPSRPGSTATFQCPTPPTSPRA